MGEHGHHRELCISGAESSSAGVGAIGHKYREKPHLDVEMDM